MKSGMTFKKPFPSFSLYYINFTSNSITSSFRINAGSYDTCWFVELAKYQHSIFFDSQKIRERIKFLQTIHIQNLREISSEHSIILNAMTHLQNKIHRNNKVFIDNPFTWLMDIIF